MNLSAIPDADLLREYRRRRAAAPKRPKGRPKVPTKCPRCGAQCESWREAQSHCKGAK